ncbi:hypothetical protein Tco_1193962 [Tanacetum coccineum]
MMGRELEGLSYKVLDNLEPQLYDGIVAVKNRNNQKMYLTKLERRFEKLNGFKHEGETETKDQIEVRSVRTDDVKNELHGIAAKIAGMLFWVDNMKLIFLLQSSASLAAKVYVVPMKNGDLDSKGVLASIVKSDGTIQSFKVYIPVRTKRILKKMKLKINVHKPVGTQVVSDEEGNMLPQLATLADTSATDSALLDKDKGDFQHYICKRIKEKEKHKKARDEVDDEMDWIKTPRMSKDQR